MAEKSEPVKTGARALGMSASWYFWLGADAERGASAKPLRPRGSGRVRSVTVGAPKGLYVSVDWRFDLERDAWQVWLDEISHTATDERIARRLDMPHPFDHEAAATAIQALGGPGSTCDVDCLADALYECLKDIEKQEGKSRA